MAHKETYTGVAPVLAPVLAPVHAPVHALVHAGGVDAGVAVPYSFLFRSVALSLIDYR